MRWYHRFCRWIARPSLPNEHGYAMAFWAIFMGAVIMPLLVLSWDVGRLFYARGEIQKAADAAALAAAREVDVQHYMLTGEVLIHQGALVQASHYAVRNISYLPSKDIHTQITRVVVNNNTRTVYVQMTADVSPLFPDYIPVRPISAWGEAQVRVSGR